jgi:tryptophan-rich sensory protein
MKIMDILKLSASIILCQLAGWIGSLATIPSIPTWYETLKKPSFTPPNWIFGPVWISLYAVMGISLFLVWRDLSKPKVKTALILFFVQLIFNILWSLAFFGLRSTLAGLIDIFLLWVAILLTIKNFFNVSKIAGLLLLPYLLWVSFAVLLNFSLWLLNL